MDVNAIIFYAEIFPFDKYLEEDPKVNRLQHSFKIWDMICKSKLITKVLAPPSLLYHSCRAHGTGWRPYRCD
jgi:hypothetical protein